MVLRLDRCSRRCASTPLWSRSSRMVDSFDASWGAPQLIEVGMRKALGYARSIALMSGSGTNASSCHSQRSKTYLHSHHSLIALAGIDNQRKARPEIPWRTTVHILICTSRKTNFDASKTVSQSATSSFIRSLSDLDSFGMSRSSARSDMNWSSLICFHPQPNRRSATAITKYSNQFWSQRGSRRRDWGLMHFGMRPVRY
jgi:hypothetical protein